MRQFALSCGPEYLQEDDMALRQIKAYQATNGEIFNDQLQALKYELALIFTGGSSDMHERLTPGRVVDDMVEKSEQIFALLKQIKEATPRVTTQA